MLQLEIQRGKHEMPKRMEFFRQYGATTSCVIRAMKQTGNSGQKEDSHRPNLYYGDSWFASVKTADLMAEFGHDFIGPVKTSTNLFIKKELEEKMQNWPGGTHLTMEALSPSGNALLAIGYKYNKRKVLCFIATKNAGSTFLGDPYRARFVGENNNLRSRPVDRPQIISRYFQQSNMIDKHNHARQAELKLEKNWRTTNCWFRLVTTFIGITVVDSWKAYRHSVDQNKFKVCDFAFC
jgi:Transposase IS4